MSNSASLEEKFHAAVKAIQRLPNDGSFQPSNEMKLTFYGLYKQATVGPCNESRPSFFNLVNRAKWDAWDKCRSMSKQAAMVAYIDEIRKILETMPQTNEVLRFTQLIGPFYEFVDDQPTEQTASIKTNSHRKKTNSNEFLVNGTGGDDHHEHSSIHTNGPTHNLVSSSNGPVPSSSSSSSSSSTISSSDVDEYYEDPSGRFPLNSDLPNEEIESTNTQSLPISNIPHVYGGQDGTSQSIHPTSHHHHHHRRGSSTHSSYRQHQSSDNPRHSFSSIHSGNNGDNRHPNNNFNKETQRAILTALTKLQRDVNNILERLNRLETSTHFLQQREVSRHLHCSSSSTTTTSLTRWLPLTGLRRRAVAFILLWPFFVFAVIRLFLRARIIIRFRQPRL